MQYDSLVSGVVVCPSLGESRFVFSRLAKLVRLIPETALIAFLMVFL
jgi:hypothetical protein